MYIIKFYEICLLRLKYKIKIKIYIQKKTVVQSWSFFFVINSKAVQYLYSYNYFRHQGKICSRWNLNGKNNPPKKNHKCIHLLCKLCLTLNHKRFPWNWNVTFNWQLVDKSCKAHFSKLYTNFPSTFFLGSCIACFLYLMFWTCGLKVLNVCFIIHFRKCRNYS